MPLRALWGLAAQGPTRAFVPGIGRWTRKPQNHALLNEVMGSRATWGPRAGPAAWSYNAARPFLARAHRRRA